MFSRMTSSAALFVTGETRGTKRVQHHRMRKHTVTALSFAVAMFSLLACDSDRTPTIAGIGGGTIPPGSSTGQLAITPSSAEILVGGTVQLTTNAPAALQGQIEWFSLSPTIASVSQTGLVTGGGIGSATIRARAIGDTTNVATAVVVVRP